MKLEPNMYVRTKEGQIFKFVKIENKQYRRTWVSDNETITTAFELKDVAKASYNIIDLIEEGDYVNGLKVQKVNNEIKGFGTIVFDKDTSIFEDYIYSIVTKEQFESMSYKVGGND